MHTTITLRTPIRYMCTAWNCSIPSPALTITAVTVATPTLAPSAQVLDESITPHNLNVAMASAPLMNNDLFDTLHNELDHIRPFDVTSAYPKHVSSGRRGASEGLAKR